MWGLPHNGNDKAKIKLTNFQPTTGKTKKPYALTAVKIMFDDSNKLTLTSEKYSSPILGDPVLYSSPVIGSTVVGENNEEVLPFILEVNSSGIYYIDFRVWAQSIHIKEKDRWITGIGASTYITIKTEEF